MNFVWASTFVLKQSRYRQKTSECLCLSSGTKVFIHGRSN